MPPAAGRPGHFRLQQPPSRAASKPQGPEAVQPASVCDSQAAQRLDVSHGHINKQGASAMPEMEHSSMNQCLWQPRLLLLAVLAGHSWP